ncbi:glycosyltransferase family 4 protein [Leisingera sp. ANG-DT]|uniref:glycosyltransferase family 4 protein n=1 Tax=Leisingera sp. ANG-DT TaxID=1577897 RepID=UPI00057EBE76|nr:glycosyltransferase family 4 protein [Leisingera sp. ANG-DT]KIC16534.1 glycosyl transferase family 1 [Leisingera sp. ANG-DT]
MAVLPGTGKRVAFYAPMKPPHHPVPSGDREIARNLIDLMSSSGAEVQLVSDIRTYDKHGDTELQSNLRSQAAIESSRLIEKMQEADLWVTYHNYYKAPDLIGPVVAHARGIPYVQIESTRAKKRLTGGWEHFAKAAHAAADAAAAIFYFTEQDRFALERDRFGNQTVAPLPPFLPLSALPAASSLDGPMLTAGMMRAGDKLASYSIIAETLAHLPGDWRLDIGGDGPARPEIEALMSPFSDRVRFLGQLSRAELAKAYENASLFLWPGVNEAFGMVFLEAQAHGLPIVAQDRPGVRDVLLPGHYPAAEEGGEALASFAGQLLANRSLRNETALKARTHIANRHLAPAAAKRFWDTVLPLMEPSE